MEIKGLTVVILTCWLTALVQCEDVRVCTPNTCYVGGTRHTGKGRGYSSFQGISYAQPPVGQLRLRRPVRWEAGGEAELDVSGTSEVVCPQWNADLTRLLGQEDCLLLNVYVPGIAAGLISSPSRFLF